MTYELVGVPWGPAAIEDGHKDALGRKFDKSISLCSDLLRLTGLIGFVPRLRVAGRDHAAAFLFLAADSIGRFLDQMSLELHPALCCCAGENVLTEIQVEQRRKCCYHCHYVVCL